MLVALAAFALVAILWPWRFSLLVCWGSQATWELSFWSWKLLDGRLRDVFARAVKPASKPSEKKSHKPRRRRPFSLRRLALGLWQDRRELLALSRANQASGMDLLDTVTRRFTVVLAELDPESCGWLSVVEAMRLGAGWGKKIRILPDWNPEAQGGAVRWDLGFSLGSLLLLGLRILWKTPWRMLWRLRSSGRSRRAAKPA